MSALPPACLRIQAVEQNGARPFATRYLANMDSEEIWIEDPGTGDRSRQPLLHRPGEAGSLVLQTFDPGKMSVALGLRRAAGRAARRRLAATAVAVLKYQRGDHPGKPGPSCPGLAALNPRIVCAHLSGCGQSGERAALPGQGHLKRAGTGDLVLTGGPAVPPARKDLSVIDSVTRIAKAVGLTGAHFAAARTGPGRMSMSRSTMRRSTS